MPTKKNRPSASARRRRCPPDQSSRFRRRLAALLAPAMISVWSFAAPTPAVAAAAPRISVAPFSASPQSAAHTALGGLSVYVGYAEDKETNTPIPASFPVPWAGAPNTLFLGGTVPGQTACGTLTLCFDAGAIRLDNPGSTAVIVSTVSVDIHSSIAGGKMFNNLWGSFTVTAGDSVILTENPPAHNPTYDNFDTSGYPGNHCTPIDVVPTVTITIAGIATTLADSTHVLDTGGVDAGFCHQNESIQWRPIGAPGAPTAGLTLAAGSVTPFTGQPVTYTATLLDGGGAGTPNALVGFAVKSGPNAGLSGTATTDSNGHATFSYAGHSPGEDVVVATVSTVGSFASAPVRVLWTNDDSVGWTGADIGGATPPGGELLDTTTGQWIVQGGGGGFVGAADQFHYLFKTMPPGGGIEASLASSPLAAQAGLMIRSSTAADSAYYVATISPSNEITVTDRGITGGASTVIAHAAGTSPAHLWIKNINNVSTAYTSADGLLWYPIIGSTVSLNLGQDVLAGIAVSSQDSRQLGAVTAATVAVSTTGPPPPPPIPCPAPWTCADIGHPTPAGSQSFDAASDAWTVNAGGADITGTADQFRFLSQPMLGDGVIIVQITAQQNTSSSAKAGLMIRSSTDPGSAYYGVFVTPGTGVKVQRRSALGASTIKLANPAGTAPAYLKVSRSGATFTAFTSPDGISWTTISGSSTTLTLPGGTLEGVAVTSHNTAELGSVTASNVRTSS